MNVCAARMSTLGGISSPYMSISWAHMNGAQPHDGDDNNQEEEDAALADAIHKAGLTPLGASLLKLHCKRSPEGKRPPLQTPPVATAMRRLPPPILIPDDHGSVSSFAVSPAGSSGSCGQAPMTPVVPLFPPTPQAPPSSRSSSDGALSVGAAAAAAAREGSSSSTLSMEEVEGAPRKSASAEMGIAEGIAAVVRCGLETASGARGSPPPSALQLVTLQGAVIALLTTITRMQQLAAARASSS